MLYTVEFTVEQGGVRVRNADYPYSISVHYVGGGTFRFVHEGADFGWTDPHRVTREMLDALAQARRLAGGHLSGVLFFVSLGGLPVVAGNLTPEDGWLLPGVVAMPGSTSIPVEIAR